MHAFGIYALTLSYLLVILWGIIVLVHTLICTQREPYQKTAFDYGVDLLRFLTCLSLLVSGAILILEGDKASRMWLPRLQFFFGDGVMVLTTFDLLEPPKFSLMCLQDSLCASTLDVYLLRTQRAARAEEAGGVTFDNDKIHGKEAIRR